MAKILKIIKNTYIYIEFIFKVIAFNQPPKPYKVLPCLLSANTTSNAVTVFLLACSVYVTASLTIFSKKLLSTVLLSS